MNEFVFLSWRLGNTWNLKSKFKFQVFLSCQDRKTNSFIHYLGEVTVWQFCFEIYWPLGRLPRFLGAWVEMLWCLSNHSNVFDKTILFSKGWNSIFINTLKRGAVCVQNRVAAAAATVSFWKWWREKGWKSFPIWYRRVVLGL